MLQLIRYVYVIAYLMKKVLLIVFMSFYFFGSTMFIQLFKLPMVFIHYKNHLSHNQKLGFVYFLTSHYDAAGDGDEFDNEEESNMPFMHNINLELTISLVIFSILKIESPIISYLGKKHIIYNQNYFPEVYELSLIKPPSAIAN